MLVGWHCYWRFSSSCAGSVTYSISIILLHYCCCVFTHLVYVTPRLFSRLTGRPNVPQKAHLRSFLVVSLSGFQRFPERRHVWEVFQNRHETFQMYNLRLLSTRRLARSHVVSPFSRHTWFPVSGLAFRRFATKKKKKSLNTVSLLAASVTRCIKSSST